MPDRLSMLELDLRQLPAPEPMERILQCLATLRAGEQLLAITPYPPLPLLPILESAGFAYHLQATADAACIWICYAQDRDRLQPIHAP